MAIGGPNPPNMSFFANHVFVISFDCLQNLICQIVYITNLPSQNFIMEIM